MSPIAIVTGASKGLGRAISMTFVENGYDVIGVGRHLEGLSETADLVQGPGSFHAVPADLTLESDVDNVVRRANELGDLKVLVNNAGGGASGWNKPLLELSEDEWHRGIDRNLSTAFLCSKAVLPAMLATGGGRIINVASGWAFRGPRGAHVAYSVAKAGVVQLTRVIAVTYGAQGIRCTCIVPGLFPHRSDPTAQLTLGASQPAGRVGQPEEIGGLALFLASDDADHLNGTSIACDGGALAGGLAPPGAEAGTWSTP